jgi:NAD(P)-dependent dehydrogenase (short-subunit alcohol dehydrogenase family)
VDLLIRSKRFLVVGGTSGIGLAAAQALLSDGASVVVAGRDRDRASKAVEALRAYGPDVHAVCGDLSRASGADEVVAAAVHRLAGRYCASASRKTRRGRRSYRLPTLSGCRVPHRSIGQHRRWN